MVVKILCFLVEGLWVFVNGIVDEMVVGFEVLVLGVLVIMVVMV